MNNAEILRKAERGEGLTAEEVMQYQKLVKPQTHVYGKYGTLKRKYLEDKGIDWTIANLPEYLHEVDRQADRMYEVMYEKLSKSEKYKKTGDFIKDLQIETEIRNLIEEEILNEIVYV